MHPLPLSAPARALFRCALASGAIATTTTAQCLPLWDNSVPGIGGGGIYAMHGATDGSVLVAGNPYLQATSSWAPAARWTGSAWLDLGFPTNGVAHAILEDSLGRVIVGGSFSAPLGQRPQNVQRLDGGSWTPMATANGDVLAIVEAANGDLIVGGGFTQLNGSPIARVGRWNGSSWAQIGNGIPTDSVSVLALLPNGDLIAGGNFGVANGAPGDSIARFDGTSWLPMGAGTNGSVASLAVMPDGSLIAAGSFSSPARNAARWNGTSWSPLGAGLDGAVYDLEVLADSRVVAVGSFQNAGGAPADRVAVWDGQSWSPIGSGGNATIRSVGAARDGSLLLGSGTAWTQAGGLAIRGVARVLPSCPANVVSVGAQCAGASLRATSLPWLGASFDYRVEGLPNPSIAIGAVGFSSAATPLSSVILPARAGCLLTMQPADIKVIQLITTGTLRGSMAIPSHPNLVGLQFWHQFVAIELGPNGAVVDATSTSALMGTIGSLGT